MNNILKIILIGAAIGLILGVAGNFAGRKALDYNADYNFPGADDSKINKDLDENFKAEYPHTNTVAGGAVIGLVAGALIGVCVSFFRTETHLILSVLIGFFAAAFIASPYPFYPVGTVPPVAFAYRMWVFVPGMLLAFGTAFLLATFKPAEPELPETIPAVEETPVKQDKKSGGQWHAQKKKK